MSKTIILTGFMGTGKTAVGKEVARRLGLPFIDMDTEIESRAEKSIPRIFREDGESAFREMEAALCAELATKRFRQPELGSAALGSAALGSAALTTGTTGTTGATGAGGTVIATGGGALVRRESLALMKERGLVICLDASPEEIVRRLDDKTSRPLLDVRDPRAEVERLLAARGEAYDAIPWHVDTTGLSIEESARRVLALAEAAGLSVRYPGGAYQIRVGVGLLNHVGGALRAAGIAPGTRVGLVSNDVVAPLYAHQVEGALRVTGLRPFVCLIPDGEQYKTLATVATLYEQFLKGGLDRGGAVLSLGGGVTGDIAGYAAATFMRGVDFGQVPTTLLAMVDASVGGKTGVDLPQGKNLVGAFKQPTCVTIDPSVLDTLEETELRSGMAEVLKHGIIGDPELFFELKREGERWGARDALRRITPAQITRALQVKITIVEEDPYEGGRRAVLNLGHTVGHALEKLSRFKLRHGEAVSIGIVAAARIAATCGSADGSMVECLEATLAAWGLPVSCAIPGWPRFQSDAIWEAMAHDKKRRGDKLRWVLPESIGEATIRDDVPKATVVAVLQEMGAA